MKEHDFNLEWPPKQKIVLVFGEYFLPISNLRTEIDCRKGFFIVYWSLIRNEIQWRDGNTSFHYENMTISKWWDLHT